MALTDESNGTGMVMPVQPMGYSYGGNMGGGFGFGGDWAWILLLLVLGGGWGGFGGFGMGGYGAMMGMGMMGMDYLYPWLNNSQNINDGFRDQQLSTQVSGIQNAVTSGFGDVQLGIAGVNQNVSQGFASTNLGMCQGFNGVNTAISGAQNAVTQQLYNNEIANLNRSFAEQTANAQGFNGVNAGMADIRYTVATEACNDRAAVGDALQNVTMQNVNNTNLLVSTIRDGIQSLKDDLCADRLAASQRETEAERRENANLRSELLYARGQAARLAESDAIINGTYSRLKDCPVGTYSVCNPYIYPQQQTPCGCNNGCGNFG
jgi:hypothetical protein